MSELIPPPVLFFALGALAAALRSDLHLPDALAKALSLYLMVAIGLKGGFAIAAPNRRPPFRTEPEPQSEPAPKTRTAGGGA